jgi:hypothetical protein
LDQRARRPARRVRACCVTGLALAALLVSGVGTVVGGAALERRRDTCAVTVGVRESRPASPWGKRVVRTAV